MANDVAVAAQNILHRLDHCNCDGCVNTILEFISPLLYERNVEIERLTARVAELDAALRSLVEESGGET
jgi:hypothetical protein